MRATLAVLLIFCTPNAFGQDEQRVQPYIERLKKGMPEPEGSHKDYTREIQKELPPDPYQEGEYLRVLQQTNPLNEEPGSEGYSKEIQKTLPPQPQGGAIKAVADGKSELHLKRGEQSNQAVGIRLGTVFSFRATGKSDRPFKEVYDADWNPSAHLFYEFQPLRNFYLGSIGFFLGAGFSHHAGNGVFEFELANEKTGNTFGKYSQTVFRFNTVPLMLGATYRMHILHWLQPFASAAPSVVLYSESRDDNKDGFKGNSLGFYVGAGVNLALDWISRRFAFDVYSDYGAKRLFLTVQFDKLSTFSGPVTFDTEGVFSGFTFEF